MDPCATLRALVRHCGLEWDEACLGTSVGGASVDFGKHYEKQLEPLRRKLDDAGMLTLSWPTLPGRPELTRKSKGHDAGFVADWLIR